jgi:hypothetical protein
MQHIDKKRIWDNFVNSNAIVLFLLAFNLLFRVYIYFNTNLFEFSDYKSYLNAIETIRERGSIPLVGGASHYFNSYIGYFFKYIAGNMDYYYLFNCCLGTLSSFFIYIFLVKSFRDRKIGIIYLTATSVYSEFITLSSVFYTQVIEVFLFSIMINFILCLHRSKKVVEAFLYIVVIVIIINVSFLLKPTMQYLWLIIGMASIMYVKMQSLSLKYLVLALTLFSVDLSLEKFYPDIHFLTSTHDVINKNAAVSFFFFGHTLYGGDGGEGAFIYKEKRIEFDSKFRQWYKEQGIATPTGNTVIDFKKAEIKRFITEQPLQWIKLQGYKLVRTFGIIPEGTTFQVLFSGVFSYNWILTALFLQIPFLSFIILLVICFDWSWIKENLKYRFTWIWISLFTYWIIGSIFYGPFQERYRIPIMVIFIIPTLSFLIARFSFQEFMNNKKPIMVKAIAMSLIFSIWASQAYNALVIRKDRYLNFVNKSTNINEMINELDELKEVNEKGRRIR